MQLTASFFAVNYQIIEIHTLNTKRMKQPQIRLEFEIQT